MFQPAATAIGSSLEDATKEVTRGVILPTVNEAADSLVPLAEQLTGQVDTVLSKLAYSCRRNDPELLDELRGELLYMATVLEPKVRVCQDGMMVVRPRLIQFRSLGTDNTSVNKTTPVLIMHVVVYASFMWRVWFMNQLITSFSCLPAALLFADGML